MSVESNLRSGICTEFQEANLNGHRQFFENRNADPRGPFSRCEARQFANFIPEFLLAAGGAQCSKFHPR